MAKVKLNPLIAQLSGKMGDVVFRVSSTGKTTIAKRPDMSHVKWSPAQKTQRERFKQAAAYAKAALDQPAVRAVYEQRGAQQHKTAYAMAISDFFNGNDLISKNMSS